MAPTSKTRSFSLPNSLPTFLSSPLSLPLVAFLPLTFHWLIAHPTWDWCSRNIISTDHGDDDDDDDDDGGGELGEEEFEEEEEEKQ
jgi:hypothetical protein